MFSTFCSRRPPSAKLYACIYRQNQISPKFSGEQFKLTCSWHHSVRSARIDLSGGWSRTLLHLCRISKKGLKEEEKEEKEDEGKSISFTSEQPEKLREQTTRSRRLSRVSDGRSSLRCFASAALTVAEILNRTSPTASDWNALYHCASNPRLLSAL